MFETEQVTQVASWDVNERSAGNNLSSLSSLSLPQHPLSVRDHCHYQCHVGEREDARTGLGLAFDTVLQACEWPCVNLGFNQTETVKGQSRGRDRCVSMYVVYI